MFRVRLVCGTFLTRLPHPRLSFIVSVVICSYFMHSARDSVMYTQLSLLLPHETMVRSHMPSARAGRNPSRGRRRRNRSRKPSCTSRRRCGRRRREARATVGAVGAVDAARDAVCVLGAGPPSLQRESEALIHARSKYGSGLVSPQNPCLNQLGSNLVSNHPRQTYSYHKRRTRTGTVLL